MGTFSVPNPDFTPGAVIQSLEHDENFGTPGLVSQLNDQNISDQNITPGGISNPSLADDAVEANNILDGEVGTAEIANLSVTNGKLAADAVTSSKILAGTIVGADIADATISAAKLDFTITPGVVPANSIGTVELVDGAVLLDNMAADSVNATKIIDGSIGANELASNSITNVKMADDSVGAAEIINGSVGTLELANASVTPAKQSLWPAGKKFISGGGVLVEGDIVWRPILFTDVATNRDGMGGGAADRLPIATTGIYIVTLNVFMESQASASLDWVKVRVQKNNLVDLTGGSSPAGPTTVYSTIDGPFMSCTTVVQLNAGDYVNAELINSRAAAQFVRVLDDSSFSAVLMTP